RLSRRNPFLRIAASDGSRYLKSCLKAAYTPPQRSLMRLAVVVLLLSTTAISAQRGAPDTREQSLVDAAKSDVLPGSLPALANLARFYKSSNRPGDEAEVYARIANIWS